MWLACDAETSGWGLMSTPGLARQGWDEQADEQFRIFTLYQSIGICEQSLRGVWDRSDKISREHRRRANWACGRLNSTEGGQQPLGQFPAVIITLCSCTKELYGNKFTTYVYTMLWIVDLCVFSCKLRYEFITGEFPFYSVCDWGVCWFCFVHVLICIM